MTRSLASQVQIKLLAICMVVVGCSPNESLNSAEFLKTTVFVTTAEDKFSSNTHFKSAAIIEPGVENGVRQLKNTFAPASVQKLLTTAYAIETLGLDFKFQTQVYIKKVGQKTILAVAADGDPTPILRLRPVGSTPRNRGEVALFNNIALALKKAKVTNIDELWLVEASPLQQLKAQGSNPIAEGVEASDYRDCYGTRPGNFNLNWNCADAVISEGRLTWNDVANQEMGFGSSVQLSNGIKKDQQQSFELSITLSPERTYTQYQIAGTLGSDGKPLLRTIPVPDNELWYGQALLEVLRQNKIAVGLKIRTGLSIDELRGDSPELMVWSPPLSELITWANKESVNFYAEALLRRALIQKKPASQNPYRDAAEDLQNKIQSWLQEVAQKGFYQREELNSPIVIKDGSGLSLDNRISVAQLHGLLRLWMTRPYFKSFLNSLAVAGRDGTLRGRMKSSAAEGRVFAKTGTVTGFYQIAGYFQKLSSEELKPFVLFTEAPKSQKQRVRNFQDQVLIEAVTR